MEFAGKKVSVIGLGKTSLALARLLRHLGAEPFVSEHRPQEECADHVKALESEGIPFECGAHSERVLKNTGLVIPSPGVPPTIPILESAREAGIPLMSELEFASRFSTSTLIAVTGTNGKTTTTELIAHLMRQCGMDVGLAGNNACPFSEAVMQERQPEFLVLEVSSYQLELVDTFRPQVGCVLNVSNDHLGRHGTMENYAATKAKVFARQGEGDVAIVNADDAWTTEMGGDSAARIVRFGTSDSVDVCLRGEDFVVNGKEVANRGDSPLPGRHNTENILAALAIMSVFNVDWEEIQHGLASFRGVEHRIEKVADIEGVAYYNDSKSTNLDSLKVALESFEGSLLLIAGGEGKGGGYSVLRDLIQERVKQVIAIGADAEVICRAWGAATKTAPAADMRSAVEAAHRDAEPGDVVLLSPACASFDMYQNFEERGADFKTCVRTISSGGVSV
jgi:UDP-N-acetylmuramoylalanine--D-glutamate ligase